MEMIRKILFGEIKSINEEAKTLTAIISTKQEDRDGDVIEPSSFKEMIKHYKKHPILLADHNYYDLRKQIGIAKKIEIGASDVRMTFEYLHGMGNGEADWAWELAKRGIASFSIGFIGHDWEPIEKKDESGNKYISGKKFTRIELLEVSQVLVPSNRSALQASAELCEVALKHFADNPMPERPEVKSEDKPEAKPEDKAKPETEPEKHYTEIVLGEAVESTKAESGGIIIEAVKNAIKEIVGE